MAIDAGKPDYTSPPQAPIAFTATPESITLKSQRICDTTQSVLDRLVSTVTPETATFSNTIKILAEDDDARLVAAEVLDLYHTVHPDAALRKAASEAAEKREQFMVDALRRGDVFRLVQAVYQKYHRNDEGIAGETELEELDTEQLKYLAEEFRSGVRRGLLLDNEDQEKVRETKKQLASLKREFTRGITEAESVKGTEGEGKGGIWLTRVELDGMPEHVMQSLKRGEDGSENEEKYLVSFKYMDYSALMSNVHSGETRRRAFLGFKNQFHFNAPLFIRIIQLRAELARLLGYSSHAAFVLEEKMAKTPEAVRTFLLDLFARAQPHEEAEVAAMRKAKRADLAERRMAELKLMKERGGGEEEDKTGKELKKDKGDGDDDELYLWDTRYYSHCLLSTKQGVNSDLITQHFPLHQTVDRMLSLFGDLFGFVFVPIDHETALRDKLIWHRDVQAFSVWNAPDFDGGSGGSEFVGYLYLDLLGRNGKYSHAMCYAVQLGYRRGKERHDILYPSTLLIANFGEGSDARDEQRAKKKAVSKSAEGKEQSGKESVEAEDKDEDDSPFLLCHHDVWMLFHELGHGMHDLSGRARYTRFFGAQTVGDFNEAPSQMLENWCWLPEGLRRLGGHRVTGEPLSEETIKALAESRHGFDRAILLGQLRMSLFDLEVHDAPLVRQGEGDLEEVDVRGIWRTVQEMGSGGIKGQEPSDGFAGRSYRWLIEGSGVSYYQYYWSNVTAMDFFDTAFKKNPLDGEAGRRYRRNVLQKGATQDEVVTVREFLGRDTRPEPFLETLGFL